MGKITLKQILKKYDLRKGPETVWFITATVQI